MSYEKTGQRMICKIIFTVRQAGTWLLYVMENTDLYYIVLLMIYLVQTEGLKTENIVM